MIYMSLMMTEMVQVIVDNEVRSHIGFRVVYLYLTLLHSKGHGERHAHFDNDYIGNGDRCD